MSSHFISYQNSKIHYLKSGSGGDVVLCLHGFAEAADSFELLFPYGGKHTFIALDLPHHGLTDWKDDHNFTPADLKSIIELCPDIQMRKFDLLGYSMGGRISLSMLEFMPDKVNRVVLIAPDGIKINFWYWLSTQTSAGNRLFKYTMNNPQWFAGLLKFFAKLGFANESIARFVHRFLDDTEMRHRVYNVWTTMRKFKPAMSELHKIVKEYHVPIRLIYGKYDRIIRYENAKKLTAGIESHCEVKVLETGHQLLQPKNATEIFEALNK